MIEVQKKGDEKFEVMVRRFNREVQQSGVLSVAKKNRYFEKDLNRKQKRDSAIRKNAIQSLKRGY